MVWTQNTAVITKNSVFFGLVKRGKVCKDFVLVHKIPHANLQEIQPGIQPNFFVGEKVEESGDFLYPRYRDGKVIPNLCPLLKRARKVVNSVPTKSFLNEKE